jgi:hypothetical protein
MISIARITLYNDKNDTRNDAIIEKLLLIDGTLPLPPMFSGEWSNKPVTKPKDNGYAICKCGKYAYIYSDEVLQKLSNGYDGELCKDCNMIVVPIDKMIELGIINADATHAK